MSRRSPEKLQVAFNGGFSPEDFIIPHRNTPARSGAGHSLFPDIRQEFDHEAIRRFYTRLTREELMGDVKKGTPDRSPSLAVTLREFF